jgi:hypothetical protein
MGAGAILHSLGCCSSLPLLRIELISQEFSSGATVELSRVWVLHGLSLLLLTTITCTIVGAAVGTNLPLMLV